MRQPVAPIGWPKHFSPPEGFTATSPSTRVWPSRTNAAASPGPQKPRSWVFSSSVIVKQSWHSQTSTSSAGVVIPASS